MILWRVAKVKFKDHMLSGEGPRRCGGRWTPVGLPVLYAAETLALAKFECMVHYGPEAKVLAFCQAEIQIPDDIEIITPPVPPYWNQEPAPPELQAIGRDYLATRGHCAIRVPSVESSAEYNFVFNVYHPRYPEIRILSITDFRYDGRIWEQIHLD